MLEKIKAISDLMDHIRLFPRVFISLYMYLLYDSVEWFMLLQVPSMEQAGLISVMTAIGAPWFAAYVTSGQKIATPPAAPAAPAKPVA